MKYFKYLFILIVFFKTETLLSADRIFSVNNIELAKKGDITQDELVNKAIKKGFKDLVERILLRTFFGILLEMWILYLDSPFPALNTAIIKF